MRIYSRLFVFLALAALLAACGSTTGNTGNTPTPASTPTPTPVPPTPTPTVYKVGQAVTVGSWQITVNSLKTSTGSNGTVVITVDPGKIFLLINVTMKNTGPSAQTASSMNFTLKQSDGTIVQNSSSLVSATLGSPAPDGSVASGDKLRGDLAFTPDKTEKSFTLTYQGVVWNLTL